MNMYVKPFIVGVISRILSGMAGYELLSVENLIFFAACFVCYFIGATKENKD